MKIMLSSL